MPTVRHLYCTTYIHNIKMILQIILILSSIYALSSKWTPNFWFASKTLNAFFVSAIRTTWPSQPTFLEFIKHLVRGMKHVPHHYAVFWSPLLYSHRLEHPIPSPAPYSVTLSSLKTNIEPQVLDLRTRSLVTRSNYTSSQKARYFLLFHQ